MLPHCLAFYRPSQIIFLAVEAVVYLVAAIYIDILSSNPEAMAMFQKFCCCVRSSEKSAVSAIPDDDDVVAEQQRVLNGGANDDAIVMSELTKVYPNGKIAVNQLSLGIPPGECFGLLGTDIPEDSLMLERLGFPPYLPFILLFPSRNQRRWVSFQTR